MKKPVIAIIFLVVLGIIGYLIMHNSNKANNAEIADETNRLASISFQRNLTQEDIITLQSLVEKTEFEEEFEELQWMIEHGLQKHVQHALGSIHDKALGIEDVCPADPLTHIGVYLQYNETHLAEHAAEEGEEALDKWESESREANAANSSYYPNLDEALNLMKKVIEDMKSKNYATAEKDSNLLGDNAYC